MKHLCKLFLTVAFCSVLASCSNSGKDDTALLLRKLDRTIEHREQYITRREQRIDSLNRCYDRAGTPAAKFEQLGRLLEDYRSYNSDSAMSVCRRRQEIAPTPATPTT